jgi:hypothetical protein
MQHLGGCDGLIADIVGKVCGTYFGFSAGQRKPGVRVYGFRLPSKSAQARCPKWVEWVDQRGQYEAEKALMAAFAQREIGALVRIGRGTAHKYSIIIELEDRPQALPSEVIKALSKLQKAERAFGLSPQSEDAKRIQRHCEAAFKAAALKYMPNQVGSEYGA